jgi:hypothetical protein
MYLNAWFDGVHDGDWDDVGPCTPPGGGAAQPSYEWILQNQPINMNAIPAGGFSDLSFTTERVLNTSLWARHWVRFTLSEQPAVVPPAGLPDGRGRPHPADPNGFTYGETEDFLHFIPQGEPGKIVIDKQVQTGTDPLNFAGTATYQIKVRHEGGTAPAQAIIRDLLPLPLNEMHIIGSVDVSTNGNGAAPLVAAIGIEPNEFKHGVTWEGVLAPPSPIVVRVCAMLILAVPIMVSTAPFTVARPGPPARVVGSRSDERNAWRPERSTSTSPSSPSLTWRTMLSPT